MAPDILKYEFNKHKINISFRTNNNAYRFLKYNNAEISLENKTGIYKLKCNDCESFYLGEIGRSFLTRYQEHQPTSQSKILKFNFAKHIIDKNHHYTDFTTNLEAVYFCKKGKYMNALEEFEKYKELKNYSNLMNDKLNFESNYLYDTAISCKHKLQ